MDRYYTVSGSAPTKIRVGGNPAELFDFNIPIRAIHIFLCGYPVFLSFKHAIEDMNSHTSPHKRFDGLSAQSVPPIYRPREYLGLSPAPQKPQSMRRVSDEGLAFPINTCRPALQCLTHKLYFDIRADGRGSYRV